MLDTKSSTLLNDFYTTLATTVLSKLRYIDKLAEFDPDNFETWPAEFKNKLNDHPEVRDRIQHAKDIASSDENLSSLTDTLKDRKNKITRGSASPQTGQNHVKMGLLINNLDADRTYIAPDLLNDEKDPVLLKQIQDQHAKDARDKRERELQRSRSSARNTSSSSNRSSSSSSGGSSSSSRRNDDDNDVFSVFRNTGIFDDTPSSFTNDSFGGFGGGDFGGGGAGGDYYKQESRPKRFNFEKPRF